MSNNNITLNPFTGLFRSMSRRSSQRHNPNTETSTPQQRGDVDMDSQQQSPVTPAVTVSNTDATLSNLPADAGHDVGNESDSSMPVLEDVSDSSDSDGAVDYDDEDDDQAMDTSEAFDVTASSSFIPGFVGIQSDFHTHDDEGGDGDDDGVMPPLEPVRLARPQGTRRARVEDDVDGDSERDRRHPSQRASRHPTPVPSASAIRPPERQAGVPGVAADPLPSNPHRRHRHHHPYQPIAMNFLSQMGFGGTGHAANLQPSGNRPQSNPREGASQGNGQQPATPRNPITTILELLQAGGQTGAFTTTFNGAPPAPAGGDGDATANNRFLNLLATISGLNGGTFTFNSETGGFPFFGMRQVPEREDPERAKVLVDGLEEVPPGLIRRLERISPESSGCAICWEKLLEDAAEYLRREEEEEKNKTTEDAIKTDSEKQPDMSVNTTAGPAAVPSTSSTRARIPKYPRIVTLPCSHVFHADCLIPWFTRPHQTTCPTCRFNIDPDNLTHGIGARRRAAASASGGDVAAEVGGPVPDPTRIEDSANVAGGNGEFVQGFFGVVEGGPEGPTYAPVAPPHFTTMRAAAPARNSFFPFSRSATTIPRRTASAGESSTPSPSARASTNPSAPTSNSSSTPATNNSGIQGTGTNSSANGSSASTAPTAPVSREHLVWPSAPRAQPVLPQTIMNEQMQGLAQAFAPHPRPNPTQRPRSERAMNVATNNILSTSDSSDASTNNGSSATSANSNASSSSVNLGPQITVQSTVPPPSGAHVHFQPQSRAHHRRHHPQPGNFVIGFDFVVTNSSPEEPENENEHDDNTTPLSTGMNPHPTGGIPMNVGGVEWTLEQIPFDPPGWGMQPGDSFASAPFTLEEEQEYEVEVDQFGMPHVVNARTSGPAQQPLSFQSPPPPPPPLSNTRAPQGSIFNPATIATDLRGPFAGAASAANPASPAGPGVQRPGSAPRPPSVPRPPGGGRRRPGPQRPVGDNGNASNATGDNTNTANSQPGHRAAALDLNNYINSMLSGAVPGRQNAPHQPNEGTLPGGGIPPNVDFGGDPVHVVYSAGSHPSEQRAPREHRAWAPPAAPGLTLRQTIEKREREAGLRCWDVSCGVGPSDEDPLVTITEEQKKQVRIRQATPTSSSQEGGDVKGKGKEREETEEQSEPIYVCEHTFHPPCVVSAQRAALNGAEEVTVENGKFVEISCPVCRASGVLAKDDWEEGVRALEAGLS